MEQTRRRPAAIFKHGDVMHWQTDGIDDVKWQPSLPSVPLMHTQPPVESVLNMHQTRWEKNKKNMNPLFLKLTA